MRNPASSSASKTTTKTSTPCCIKVGLKRGPWTPEEDHLLSNYIKKEGEGRWRTLPKRAGLLRCGKSCRLRWLNYLRPSVRRGQIAPDEEDLILRLHRLLGNRWSLIAGRIPGRTDNEIKNYWNTHLSKKLISQGIDPRTHKPLALESDAHHHHLNPSSSSSTNRQPSPNKVLSNAHDYQVSSSGLEEATTCINQDNNIVHHHGYFQNTTTCSATATPSCLDDDDQFINGYTSLLMDCDGTASGSGVLDWRSSNNNNNNNNNNVINHGAVMINEEEHDHEDINSCTDDLFSSFLNSLINDEVFTTTTTTTPPPLHQQQQHQLTMQEQSPNNNGTQWH